MYASNFWPHCLLCTWLCVCVGFFGLLESSLCLLQGAESFFRSVLASMETVYLNRNPTAKAILELVHSAEHGRICYDHFAFRTLGVFSFSPLFLFNS